MWGIVGWMLNRDFKTIAYDVSYNAIEKADLDENGVQKKTETGELKFVYLPVTQGYSISPSDKIVTRTTSIAEPLDFKVGDKLNIITKNNEGTEFGYLNSERLDFAVNQGIQLNRDNGVVEAQVTQVRDNEVEITVSWFSILNSFFIIVFASFFSRWWESKYNPSAATKYALGLIIMGVGFGLLAFGSYGLVEGVKVSMVWLILAYLFHTLGELCLSPVGLSYVSKLVPARMIALMFGMWYLAIAIGNKLAAVLGGQIENITEEYSLSTFFVIFTIVPTVAGLLVFALNPVLKKLMHGVK
jgi:POT family proton-dependent oligopeptide transporter